MNKQILRSLIMTAALSAMMAGPAFADQVWDFGSLFSNTQKNTNLGSNVTFTQGSNWVTATAVTPSPWTASNCTMSSTPTAGAPCLFAKVTSGDPGETGLGLLPNDDKEIFFPDGIALQANPDNHILSIGIASVQSGESWAVAGCNAMMTSCSVVDSGVGNGSSDMVTVGLSGDFFASYVVYVPCAVGTSCSGTTAGGEDNILLVSATTSVPEPGALALFGAGLLGCALFISRRRRAQTQI